MYLFSPPPKISPLPVTSSAESKGEAKVGVKIFCQRKRNFEEEIDENE
jgi:hypothetical protein